LQRETASQSVEAAHAWVWVHAFFTMHDWHEAAASGSTRPPANAPHVSLHEVSQLLVMHALSAVTLSEEAG
jgi:hypothetical protein